MAGSLVRGHVYTAGAPTGAAVLTLVDTAAGREIAHTHTEADSSYRLAAPDVGTYLLTCLPDPAPDPAGTRRVPGGAATSEAVLLTGHVRRFDGAVLHGRSCTLNTRLQLP